MHATPSEFPQLPPGEKVRPAAAFVYAAGAQPVPGFTIKRGLGHGGFGEVYYAVSDAGKEVALKLVRRNLDIELRGVTQCLNVKHPNLIGLYDVRTDAEGNFWIVMEYVAGERLNDALDRFPQGMPVAEALAWFRGIAAGTTFLHHSGIVHRDLKPANIFSENGIVKIGDYGLSKFISVSRRSGQTESVGTVHYMAPEISGGRYGKQIDIYALGILLYELLTGRVPFDGESIGEILMKHLTAEPDLSALAEPYRGAVAAALQKDPDRRPRDVEELLLRVEGKPIEAQPDTAPSATPFAVAPNFVGQRAPVTTPVAAAAVVAPSPHHAASIDGQRRLFGLVWSLAAVGVLLLVLGSWVIVRDKESREVAHVEVPEGATVRIVDTDRPVATQPADINRQPTMSAAAPEAAPEHVETPAEYFSARAMSVGTFAVAAIAVICAVIVWGRRRHSLPLGPRLAETELLRSSAAATDRPIRKALLDSTGGWLAACIGSLVIVRLLLLFRSQPMQLPEYLWGAATTATGTALMIALMIPLRRRLIEPANRRLLAALVGMATGTAAWFYAGHLDFTPGFELAWEGVSPRSWPECYDAGRPLLPAYLIYFGATFFLVDWWSITSPAHSGGLHIADAFAALFWAGLVHLIFPFPQGWGFLVMAGCAFVLPWSMPMSRKKSV